MSSVTDKGGFLYKSSDSKSNVRGVLCTGSTEFVVFEQIQCSSESYRS